MSSCLNAKLFFFAMEVATFAQLIQVYCNIEHDAMCFLPKGQELH